MTPLDDMPEEILDGLVQRAAEELRITREVERWRRMDEWFAELIRRHPELVEDHRHDPEIGDSWRLPFDEKVMALLEEIAGRPLTEDERQPLKGVNRVEVLRSTTGGHEAWSTYFFSPNDGSYDMTGGDFFEFMRKLRDIADEWEREHGDEEDFWEDL